MKQRDIVWVRLPFSGLERQKARPALVVSNDEYNARHADAVVCAVTSNLREDPYKVRIGPKDLETGTLPLASMVRADKLLQVETALIARSFARLKQVAFDAVVERIHKLLRRPAK